MASHIIVQLLRDGHDVCATLRNLARQGEVERMICAGGADLGRLRFVQADLEADTGWGEAMAGCDYVMHVASPFPTGVPKDEDELIRPARDGTLRVLRAARDAGVQRVVMTSSFAAVGYGHAPRQSAFTEADWSNPDAPEVQAYIKSKIVAERSAWEFVADEGKPLELSVINPSGIFGPVLGADSASSIGIIKAMLDGRMPFVPRVTFGLVDVRDVAALHIAAMTAPEAAGERFIAVSGEPLSMQQIAGVLRNGLGDAGRKAPKRQLPDWLVRLLARVLPPLRHFVPLLGVVRAASNAKARGLLDWQPRPPEETIIATAKSLLAYWG